MYTGEGAEEIVEDMPTVGHHIIHEHEELAEKFAILMYITGFFGLISFTANAKNHKYARPLPYITLLFAIIATIFSFFVCFQSYSTMKNVISRKEILGLSLK